MKMFITLTISLVILVACISPAPISPTPFGQSETQTAFFEQALASTLTALAPSATATVTNTATRLPASTLTPTKPPTAVQTLAVPSLPPKPTANTNTILGKWVGMAVLENEGGRLSVQVEIVIQASCKLNNSCGSVFISAPSLSCSGTLMLIRITGDVFAFVEQNIENKTGSYKGFCGEGGYEYVYLLPDGTMAWEFSNTKLAAGFGILKRS